jgi:hypothetical protein
LYLVVSEVAAAVGSQPVDGGWVLFNFLADFWVGVLVEDPGIGTVYLFVIFKIEGGLRGSIRPGKLLSRKETVPSPFGLEFLVPSRRLGRGGKASRDMPP